MSATSPSPTLDREFLVIRAKILEIAAALDRVERIDGNVQSDQRMQQIIKSVRILADGDSNRAEAVQMIYSLPYNESWRSEFGI